MNSAMAASTRSDGSMNWMPGPIEHLLLCDVDNAAVDDASLDHERAVAEGQTEVVKGIELEAGSRFRFARRRG